MRVPTESLSKRFKDSKKSKQSQQPDEDVKSTVTVPEQLEAAPKKPTFFSHIFDKCKKLFTSKKKPMTHPEISAEHTTPVLKEDDSEISEENTHLSFRKKFLSFFQKKKLSAVDFALLAKSKEKKKAALKRKNMYKQYTQKKVKKVKLTNTQRRKNLSTYLTQAGYPDVSIDLFKKRVLFVVVNIIFTLWMIPLILAVINKKSLGFFLEYTLACWTVLFLFVYILVWGIVYFFLEMRIYKRKKELEAVLPDFLQLTSSNINAGMPIDRALWLAIRPSFGVLAKEIEDVAKSTISGEDLSVSLQKLVLRYDSDILKRSIAILLEGLSSGGELADLLSKIALNIQEIEIMKKEMSANVTTYAIFISFSSVVVAPILFALATQLMTIIINITAGLDLGSSSMMAISISPNSGITQNFKIYSFCMLSVTAGMSAAIISVITKGNVRDGIRNIPIYIITSLIIYTLMVSAFGNLMSGML